jgi:hypothetical protein
MAAEDKLQWALEALSRFASTSTFQNFVDKGYGELSRLKDMPSDEFHVVAKTAGMKEGHAMKFSRSLFAVDKSLAQPPDISEQVIGDVPELPAQCRVSL